MTDLTARDGLPVAPTSPYLAQPCRSLVEAQLDAIAKRFSGGCAVSHIDGRHGRYVGTRTDGDTVYILVARDGGGAVEPELPGYWEKTNL